MSILLKAYIIKLAIVKFFSINLVRMYDLNYTDCLYSSELGLSRDYSYLSVPTKTRSAR